MMQEILTSKNMTGQKFTIKPHKVKKRKVYWHLLLIGDNGKVFNFLRYKIFAILIIVVICLSIISACWLFYLFQNSHRENKILKESLNDFEKVVSNLKNENEILAARLVMAGIEPNLEGKKQIVNQVEGESELQKISEIEIVSPQETNDKDRDATGIEKSNQEKKNITEESFLKKEAQKSNFVTVTDFKVTHQSKRLNVNFKLSNISGQTVSGYLFVVLKNHQKSYDTYLMLPEKFLDSDGMPTNYKSGHNFKISRFKNVKFTAQHTEDLGRSFKADVFVFGKNGDLLFRQEFPVKI
jgi:hypothetical protein